MGQDTNGAPNPDELPFPSSQQSCVMADDHSIRRLSDPSSSFAANGQVEDQVTGATYDA